MSYHEPHSWYIIICTLEEKKAHQKCHPLSYPSYPACCPIHSCSMAVAQQLAAPLREQGDPLSRYVPISTSSVTSKYLHAHWDQRRYTSKEIAQMSQFSGWNVLMYLLGLESNKPGFWMRWHRKQNILNSLLFQDCIYSSWRKGN